MTQHFQLPQKFHFFRDRMPLDETPEALLKIADIEYLFDNPIEAFDRIFIIFLAFNLQYPKTSLVVWIFIEQYKEVLTLRLES